MLPELPRRFSPQGLTTSRKTCAARSHEVLDLRSRDLQPCEIDCHQHGPCRYKHHQSLVLLEAPVKLKRSTRRQVAPPLALSGGYLCGAAVGVESSCRRKPNGFLEIVEVQARVVVCCASRDDESTASIFMTTHIDEASCMTSTTSHKAKEQQVGHAILSCLPVERVPKLWYQLRIKVMRLKNTPRSSPLTTAVRVGVRDASIMPEQILLMTQRADSNER